MDALKVDVTKLSPSEQERLAFINKLTQEADDFARAAGFNVDKESDETTEKAIMDTNWSGQSDVEVTRLSTNTWSDLISRPALAFGDIASLTGFAIGGRLAHSEGINPLELFLTAAPFIFSWLFISPLLGAYSRDATSSRSNIPVKLLPAWGASIPVALVIRGLIKGYVPPTSFIFISLTVTFTAIFIWRNFYISAFGETNDKEYRDAGFLEVFKMIGTLIKRW